MNPEATVSLDVPNEIHSTRDFAAPQARVWQAFTDLEHIGAWWGPDGFVTRTQSHDLREGGHWRHMMTGPDGKEWPNFIRYTVVRPPALLAWDHGTEEAEPPWFSVEVRLQALDAQHTRVMFRHVFATAEQRDANIAMSGAVEGAKQTLARLAARLAAG